MRSRTTILLALVVFIAGLVLAACAAPAPEPTKAPEPTQAPAQPTKAPEPTQPPAEPEVKPADEIVFYNWSDYIAPDIYDLFKQETGISVVEDNYSSNEELLAKLQGGAKGYALIVPSDYTASIMIEEGMLAELDHDNIPNLANLAESFRNLPYDPGNKYCATYLWGTTGLGYNTEQLDAAPESWAVFFDPDPNAPWYGRMTLLDDVREVFSAALIYLGYDNNTKDEAQLEEAKALLIKAKAAISGFESDTFEELVGAGENLIAHGWNGDFLQAQDEFGTIGYVIPKEGGTAWIDNICIPATATPEQKLAAEMFINFILRPDIGAMLADYTFYATPNEAAREQLSEEYLSNPIINPPADVMERLHYIEPLGEFESVYQRLWDEVKSAPTP